MILIISILMAPSGIMQADIEPPIELNSESPSSPKVAIDPYEETVIETSVSLIAGVTTPPGWSQSLPDNNLILEENTPVDVEPQAVLGNWFYVTAGGLGDPYISYNYRNGQYLVTWSRIEGSSTKVYAHAFNRYGQKLTTNPRYIGTRQQNLPKTAYNYHDNQYLIGWGHYNLDVQRLDWSGTPLGSAIRVYDHVGITAGLLKIVYNQNRGEYFVLFQDQNWNLRGQRVSRSGTLIGNAFTIRASNLGGDIAYNWIDDQYLVVGTYQNNGRDIWGRILRGDGTFLKDIVIETYTGTQENPKVAWNSYDNQYLVIWTDNYSGNNDVYGRRVTATGNLTGNYIPVESSSVAGYAAAIAFNWNQGSYLAGWERRWIANSTQRQQSYVRAIHRDGTMPYPSKPIETEFSGEFNLTNGVAHDYAVVERDMANRTHGRFVQAWHSVYLPLTLREYAARLIPNDSYFTYQWGLHNTGQSGGLVNADINAPEAWYITTGSTNVTLAVLDTGVSLSHPEFSGRLVAGWDFANNDSNPDDDHGHGTHVAGIAAATGNNARGIAGVSWRTRIMPVKVLNANGSGSHSMIINGIQFAANNGAHVINMSLGGTSYSQAMQDAINYAHNRGVLVVAAAGNCGGSNYSQNGCSYQNQTNYPAAMNRVLAVAATTRTDTRSSFSNQGSYVDIAAPGSDIYSTWPGNSYKYQSGTSMAAPFVAGLATLIRARYPSYTPAQVAQAIVHNAVDLGSPGRDNAFGCGRINAQLSLLRGAINSGCSGWGGLSYNSEPEITILDSKAPFVPGVLLVKFQDDYMHEQHTETLKTFNSVILHEFSDLDVYMISVTAGQELVIAQQLSNTPGIAYAEPDFLITLIPIEE